MSRRKVKPRPLSDTLVEVASDPAVQLRVIEAIMAPTMLDAAVGRLLLRKA